jgi:hypothetical protein
VIALVVLAALVGLGIVGAVVAFVVLGDRVEEALDVDPCPFLSDADAATVFGAGATTQELTGIYSLGNVVLDTRVLPDAPSCWVVSAGDQGVARVARQQGGDAADTFAAERAKAQGGTEQVDGSTSVEATGYFLDDVELGDEAFCTTGALTGQSGVLVREGDTLVYVAVAVTSDSVGGGDRLGEVLSADEANCERARQVARLVLD